jgi:acetyl-CoA carboxylase biotin carboxylase subunit
VSRERLHGYAMRIADALQYLSLGTIEFLYDLRRDEIFFLEVNPRVQVEHPVTEMVTGIDLVRCQIVVAFGEELEQRQSDIAVDGHAIEARLTAQDPSQGLRPSPAVLTRWRPPTSGGVRWDTHLYEGYSFPPFYDALMAKIIAHGPDRAAAIARLRIALDRLEVEGPMTTRLLLRRLLDLPALVENSVTTRWLEDQFNGRALQ